MRTAETASSGVEVASSRTSDEPRVERVYAALAGVAAAGFLFLFVYVAAFVDYGDMVGADSGRTCKQVLTFVHEDWWGKPEFVDCKK